MDRQRGFFEFFAQYPEAQRFDHEHANGLTTYSVGFFQGHVDSAFLGVYKPDGALRSEERFDEVMLSDALGGRITGDRVMSLLMKLAVEKTGDVIRVIPG